MTREQYDESVRDLLAVSRPWFRLAAPAMPKEIYTVFRPKTEAKARLRRLRQTTRRIVRGLNMDSAALPEITPEFFDSTPCSPST
jgi:hypothetical protein